MTTFTYVEANGRRHVQKLKSGAVFTYQRARKDQTVTDVFISYAGDAAHQLIEDVLEEAFVDGRWGDLRTPQAAEDQMVLTAAFEAAVAAWRERKRWGKVDPTQVIYALLATAWRHIQNLDDKDYAKTDPGKIAVLMEICDPDYVLTGEREDDADPPVDH